MNYVEDLLGGIDLDQIDNRREQDHDAIPADEVDQFLKEISR
ncbi:hypothetical protein WG936_04050 [Corynebacterium sp. H127]